MANALTKLPAKIAESFKKMNKGQRTRIVVLVVIIIIIIIAVSVFLNQKSYTVLYSGMNPSEAGEVLATLTEMGVDAKAQGSSTILVAEDQADNVRMELASQGYPNSGVSYDIFQNASGLGVTEMEKQVYYQFQLQENLRQTIIKMSKVDDAVVNIDLGEESSYVLSNNVQPATASVMLTLKNGVKLETSEVEAITEIVSKSISGLAEEDVRIIDSQMNLYSTGGDTETASVDTQMGLQGSVQQQLQSQVINLLSPVFGQENVLAEVNVKLNFDNRVTESIEFEPPAGGTEGLVVSMQELIEAISSDETGSAAGVAGIDANGSASEYLAALEGDDSSVYYNISREANYEINQTKTQIEEAKGQIEDLSVSVVLNSDGADDYTEEVKQLVATAIGVEEERITVQMLPFLKAAESDEIASAMQLQQQMLSSVQSASTMRLVIIALTGLVVMIILLMIVRMFRKNKQEPVGLEYMADEVIIPGAIPVGGENADVSLDDLDGEDGKLSILEDYIGKNPESVANLLRNWLNEE
jgi:flagellar M-ring protein FliF